MHGLLSQLNTSMIFKKKLKDGIKMLDNLYEAEQKFEEASEKKSALRRASAILTFNKS
jgi:hypothetical protein